MNINLSHLTFVLHRYFSRLDRIQVLGYILAGYALVILSTVFGYTILDHDYYRAQADRQQTMLLRNTDTRGSIYSRGDTGPRGVFAVSTNLGTLAIDPTQTGSTTKLLGFLSEVVYSEFCSPPSTACIGALGAYIRQDLTQIPNLTDIMAKQMISDYISTRMETPIDAVQIQEKVSEAQKKEIEGWGEESLYFIIDTLYLNPTIAKYPNTLAPRLAKLLDLDEEEVLKKFQIRKRRHLEIIKRMSLSTRDRVSQRLDREKEVITQKQLQKEDSIVAFIKIEDNLVRFYPEQEIGGQIVGFVDNDGSGRYGVEGYFHEELSGKSPTQLVKKDSLGRPIGGYVSRDVESEKNGIDIELTIDRNIQKEISVRLKRAVQNFRADKGSIIVMDPKTGAIVASVNYPEYNPNEYGQVYEITRVPAEKLRNPSFELIGVPLFVEDSASGTTTLRYDGKGILVRKAEEYEITNFAIPKYQYINTIGPAAYSNDVVSSLYEPGSVFKAITVAIGIDSGEISPYDTYYDKGFVELDYGGGAKGKISNIAHQCLGRQTYVNALNWSCNVGMIDIIQKVGKSVFDRYVRDFGFGNKTGITLDGEVYSQISSYEKWSRTQFFTMSFGQGISATMLQMAAAYSTIANEGVYMKPYIVDSITYPDGKTVETIPTPLRRVIQSKTAEQVIAMMVDGVRRGFAAKGGVAGYTIAGKTGTSQIPYKGTYENLYYKQDLGHTITSYGGFAPAKNPKFVLIVRIDRPRSSIYSESTSSALFAEIAEYLLQYYKVPKNL